MLSETSCSACSYSIQGHEFISDFRLLELKGYDIILGADWLLVHIPVGLNLKTREFTITKYGSSLLTFQDESIPPKHLLIGPKKLYQLLKKKQACSSVIVLSTTNSSNDVEPIQDVPPAISTVL